MSDELQLTESGQGCLTFEVQVSPRAARARVGPVQGGRLKLAVTAPPVEGRANVAVVALLAKRLGLRRGDVTVVSGQRGRRKLLRVRGLTRAELLDKIRP
jgi:uncharacterized protein (TIGR00251 family)